MLVSIGCAIRSIDRSISAQNTNTLIFVVVVVVGCDWIGSLTFK